MMWYDELFALFDSNHDDNVSLRELIIACAPDIDNNKRISAHEFELGRHTAVVWVANILATVPSALDDSRINMAELRAVARDITHGDINDDQLAEAKQVLAHVTR
jgi:Ca2+-binding EF-hand superfamily protein